MPSVRMCSSSNAKWQVDNGFGVFAKAGDLHQFIGRGIYEELWRDHTWFYISNVTQTPSEQVEIEYITIEKSSKETRDGDTVIVVTDYRRIKNKLVCDAQDVILVTAGPQSDPKGTRVTVATTVTRKEEPLDD